MKNNDATNVKTVWHEGRQYMDVTDAALEVELSEAAIYKAMYEGRLAYRFILGVKAIALDDLHKVWPVAGA